MVPKRNLWIAGGAIVVAGAAVGGHVLLNDDKPSETAASASSSAGSEEAPPSGGVVARLGTVVPATADVFVDVPDVRAFAKATTDMEVTTVGLLGLMEVLEKAGAVVGTSFGMSAGDSEALLSSLSSVALAGELGAVPYAGALFVSTKPAAVEKLLASPRFSKEGKLGERDKYQVAAGTGPAPTDLEARALFGAQTIKGTAVVWFADRGVLAVGTDGFLEKVAAVMAGKEPALGSSEKYAQAIAALPPKARATIYAPADALAPILEQQGQKELAADYFADPAPVVGGVYLGPAGLRLTVHAGFGGARVPKLPLPIAPAKSLAGELPANTIAYLAYPSSLGDQQKELFEKLRTEIGDEERLLLSDLLSVLGDQGVVGVVGKNDDVSLDALMSPSLTGDLAIVGAQRVKDPKELIEILDRTVPKRMMDAYDVDSDDASFEAKPKKADLPYIKASEDEGTMRYGIGAEPLVRASLLAMKEGKTLGKEKAHALAMGDHPSAPHAMMWLDAARLLRVPSPTPDPLGMGDMLGYYKLTGDSRITASISIALSPRGEGYAVRADLLNVLSVLPVMASYGVSRYLASSKAAEAKNNLGAIARGALVAYEREAEGGKHELCGSAEPVPAVVPAGKKYQPDTTDGRDFETGDATRGWKCLRFAMTAPHYYRYGYSAGGPYKGPARGGPDPGPKGFEAWAEGDLDGDGKTSLFTAIGTVDAQGMLHRSPQVFIADEME